MFYDATSFNQDISNWDVRNVTDMSSMFRDATSFNGDVSSWDVSKVTDFNAFAFGVKIPTSTYDQILVNWSGQILKSNLTIDFGLSKYTVIGQAAKNDIITDFNWTINDGGLE
jgi:surface protein